MTRGSGGNYREEEKVLTIVILIIHMASVALVQYICCFEP
jgi:hypothetical protein